MRKRRISITAISDYRAGTYAPRPAPRSLGGARFISAHDYVNRGMGWQRRNAREPVDLDTFDPECRDYTERELEDYADAFLRKDAKENKPIGVYPSILFDEHLYNRRRREILVESGVPDETITQGLSKDGQTIYNRVHPQGRKVNSKEQRDKNGASFYR